MATLQLSYGCNSHEAHIVAQSIEVFLTSRQETYACCHDDIIETDKTPREIILGLESRIAESLHIQPSETNIPIKADRSAIRYYVGTNKNQALFTTYLKYLQSLKAPIEARR